LDGLAIPEPFDFESRVWMIAPWSGAYTQCLWVSALARCHIMTGDQKYFDAAAASMRALTVPTGHYQGMSTIVGGNRYWLEEYPSFPPQHTLNGAIYGIWSVLDWYFLTDDPTAERLYRAFVRSLEADLHHYDTGDWTYYDRFQRIAPETYHRIHITQMRRLYEQTGVEIFEHYRALWQSYLDD
jgi:hypothetical protein